LSLEQDAMSLHRILKEKTEGMLVSVGTAIAGIVNTNHLKYDYIIAKVDDPRVIQIVTNTSKKCDRNSYGEKYNNNNHFELFFKRFNLCYWFYIK
jgi:hypothetical protein